MPTCCYCSYEWTAADAWNAARRTAGGTSCFCCCCLYCCCCFCWRRHGTVGWAQVTMPAASSDANCPVRLRPVHHVLYPHVD